MTSSRIPEATLPEEQRFAFDRFKRLDPSIAMAAKTGRIVPAVVGGLTHYGEGCLANIKPTEDRGVPLTITQRIIRSNGEDALAAAKVAQAALDAENPDDAWLREQGWKVSPKVATWYRPDGSEATDAEALAYARATRT